MVGYRFMIARVKVNELRGCECECASWGVDALPGTRPVCGLMLGLVTVYASGDDARLCRSQSPTTGPAFDNGHGVGARALCGT